MPVTFQAVSAQGEIHLRPAPNLENKEAVEENAAASLAFTM